MKILVDADSCPRPARELVLRSAARLGVKAVFAANHPIPGISGNTVVMELCPPGVGAADDRIVELAERGDLAISRDVPLARRLVEAGLTVVDDRGRIYTRENIREMLSLRNFMVGLAENSMGIERAAVYGKKELKAFADSLDRLLTQLLRSAQGTGSGSV
jgi:uncharacterized protein YaiI (UPF0178 family)